MYLWLSWTRHDTSHDTSQHPFLSYSLFLPSGGTQGSTQEGSTQEGGTEVSRRAESQPTYLFGSCATDVERIYHVFYGSANIIFVLRFALDVNVGFI